MQQYSSNSGKWPDAEQNNFWKCKYTHKTKCHGKKHTKQYAAKETNISKDNLTKPCNYTQFKSYCSTVHFHRITSISQPTNAYTISLKTLIKQFKTLQHVSILSDHHQGALFLAKVILRYSQFNSYLQTRCCGSISCCVGMCCGAVARCASYDAHLVIYTFKNLLRDDLVKNAFHSTEQFLSAGHNNVDTWTFMNLMFNGPCIILIVQQRETNLMSLALLFNAQHVSDVNTSILRSLQLICWVISWVVWLWFDVCWCYIVVWLGWCGIRMQ